MPKETIAMNEPLEPDAPVSRAWSLTVGWQNELCDVQVGASIAGDYDSGQFFNLSRSQINNLIRVLRKARDHSYGADA